MTKNNATWLQLMCKPSVRKQPWPPVRLMGSGWLWGSVELREGGGAVSLSSRAGPREMDSGG